MAVTPNSGETNEEFLARCIPVAIDNLEATDEAGATEVCQLIWTETYPDEVTEEEESSEEAPSEDVAASMDTLILASPTSTGSPILTKRYKKEIVRVGQYDSGDKKFEVTQDLLKHWESSFRKMKFSGTKIPVPSSHTNDPAANRGWVREMAMSEDGKGLIATIEAIGDDAVTQVARNDVSIYSPKEYIDSKGTKWDRPIMHVALTTTPVVTGMQEAIAASMHTPKIVDKVDDKFLKLSRDNANMKLEKLVARGNISPAVSKKLQGLVTDDYLMSNSLDISLVLDILSENKPVDFKQKSGPQTLVLERVAEKRTDDLLKSVDDYNKKMKGDK